MVSVRVWAEPIDTADAVTVPITLIDEFGNVTVDVSVLPTSDERCQSQVGCASEEQEVVLSDDWTTVQLNGYAPQSSCSWTLTVGENSAGIELEYDVELGAGDQVSIVSSSTNNIDEAESHILHAMHSGIKTEATQTLSFVAQQALIRFQADEMELGGGFSIRARHIDIPNKISVNASVDGDMKNNQSCDGFVLFDVCFNSSSLLIFSFVVHVLLELLLQ